MVDVILKVTNSSFQKGMAFCRSIYVEKVMKLLAFIFEQPSYEMTACVMILFSYGLLNGILLPSKWTLFQQKKNALFS